MTTKQRFDRIGGAGSMLAGVGCLWLASTDWEMHQSMWKVWVGMCVILILNGIAMIGYALRTGGGGEPTGKAGRALTEPAVARGSTRL